MNLCVLIMSEESEISAKKSLKAQDQFGTPWKIYVSRFLSAWGDRMWAFGGGIFMTKLDQEDSLRLVAVYGFVVTISVVLFGAAIGNWIDK